MRMWMVDPRKMCRKHLLGEHVELHMMVGTINAGKRIDGYRHLVEVHNIRRRHFAIVLEMTIRGYNHKSPLPNFPKFTFGKVDRTCSYMELASRCKECRKLMEVRHKIKEMSGDEIRRRMLNNLKEELKNGADSDKSC